LPGIFAGLVAVRRQNNHRFKLRHCKIGHGVLTGFASLELNIGAVIYEFNGMPYAVKPRTASGRVLRARTPREICIELIA
jgi:hypothetical protein